VEGTDYNFPVKKKFPSRADDLPDLIGFLANFFSYLFHPIFISSYVMAFFLFGHPYLYTGFPQKIKVFRFVTVFFSSTFLPIFSVFLLWRLRLFTQSMKLQTSKERIVPYLLVMIFYFWVWDVFTNLKDSSVVTHYFLGAFLAVCFAWFCNIYFKISMHTIAMGGLVMFAVLFSLQDDYASGLYIGTAFLVAGVVSTSRFIVSDHTSFEIYSGLVMGMLAQFIAWQF
jgi:hypothetical protein